MNRILSLDVGEKRIGMAISDLMGWTAQPLYTLHRTALKKDINEILSVISKNKVNKIIAGFPKNMDGTLGYQGKLTQKFIAELLLSTDIPFEWVDERMTTLLARQMMKQSEVKKKNKKNIVDTVAATLILETYLTSHR